MRRLFGEGYLAVFMSSMLLGACNPKTPLASLRRSDITHITLADCASKQYPVADDKLIDQLWKAVVKSQDPDVGQMRQNSGFVRVWVYQKHSAEAIRFEIFSSLVKGPVISYGTTDVVCEQCVDFFTELRKTYPDFNWCHAPKIK